MKTYFAYLLFLSLALRPAYNIGYVAYFELNIDYIIETYCVNKTKPELKCNGKCHLKTQLAVSTVDLEKDSGYLSSFFDAFFPVYFQETAIDFSAINSIASLKNNWHYNSQFQVLYKDCLNPPPQDYSLHI